MRLRSANGYYRISNRWTYLLILGAGSKVLCQSRLDLRDHPLIAAQRHQTWKNPVTPESKLGIIWRGSIRVDEQQHVCRIRRAVGLESVSIFRELGQASNLFREANTRGKSALRSTKQIPQLDSRLVERDVELCRRLEVFWNETRCHARDELCLGQRGRQGFCVLFKDHLE